MMANRTERVVIKLTAQELKLVKDCAWRTRLTVAHFIRAAVATRINNINLPVTSDTIPLDLTEHQEAIRTLLTARDHDEAPPPAEIPQAEKGGKS